ncbi:hypothetical protein EHS25_003305 [Saitozyma podzolica]|uniref:DUF7729 domain-containing protein n=1 Tax=Saitozyma podzolica TaxID=1890683 RepID=A0A427Y8L8_9TREE|nr:hypothetical protein EHS25_003305 [Saitozyma podzolica]
MRIVPSLLAVTASLSVAQALSSSCTAQIAGLAVGNLGTCLQLTTLLPVLSGSGSIIDPLNTYLASLCSSSTTTCSNTTLSSAETSLSSSCSSDISGGGTDAQEIEALLAALNSYPEVYTAACSKNSTTGGYCVTETLSTVQNTTGTNVTISFVLGILSGTGNTSSLQSALSSGQLCTGCVSEIYGQALKANATIASTSIGSALTSQCGSSFGTSASGVTAPSSSGASTSAAATSATSSKSAAGSLPLGKTMLPYAVAGVSVLGSVALGFLVVL